MSLIFICTNNTRKNEKQQDAKTQNDYYLSSGVIVWLETRETVIVNYRVKR